jgi:kojibiose phosphorylase
MAVIGGPEAEPARLGELAEETVQRRSGRELDEHTRAFAARVEACDVELDGDTGLQRALRFAGYHLIGAANPDDDHVSIGARGLTGAAYMGHVFWDTEIWLLPFYTLTWPRAARALLMYRWHTLPAARERARKLGYAGALYAWESADTGEDVTPQVVRMPDGRVVPVLCGRLENHVSAAIAWATWQYWEATRDDLFLLDAGAEMVLETARFWAIRGGFETDGRFHIRGVIGPDEYHENVDDNAYTNGMAQWNLRKGAELTRLLTLRWPDRMTALAARLGLSPEEVARWEAAAEAMYTGLDPRTGIYEQFEGFNSLEHIDLAAFEPRSVAMDVLLGHERVARSQILKQADVVLMIALLWDQIPPAIREANFRYYEPRTAHGSSLSPSVHALVAARLGDVALAERYFRQTAAIDLDNRFGNAAGGVHIGALGGLWQAAVLGFGGLSCGPEGPRLEPHLPAFCRELRFPFEWRRERLLAEIGPDHARIRRRSP